MGICDARREGWYLVIIFSLMALLVFTAKMLQRVYQIGRKTFFFLLWYCRLPDCWSIKIIVMEIDLIDNVPCSHCEQLVPCEHNPETSSKNFPLQTFNPSSSFCPSLQKMKRRDAREDKILSCQVPAKQVEMWSRGKGSRIKRQERRDKNEHERKGLRLLRGMEDWPKQLSLSSSPKSTPHLCV